MSYAFRGRDGSDRRGLDSFQVCDRWLTAEALQECNHNCVRNHADKTSEHQTRGKKQNEASPRRASNAVVCPSTIICILRTIKKLSRLGLATLWARVPVIGGAAVHKDTCLVSIEKL